MTAAVGSANRTGTAASASPPVTTATGVRQSIGRMLPSSWAGQRAPIRSATNPQAAPRAASRTTRGVKRGSGAGDRELDERRVRGAVRAAGRERVVLAVVAAA